VARWVATLFGLVLLAFLIGFFNVFSDTAPAYGVPWIFFGETPASRLLMWPPLVLLVLAALMVIFMLVSWVSSFTARRGEWGFGGPLHYTLLTVPAVAVLGVLWYWNMLTFST
jgi:hypothetical protein